jgi:phosphopantothenoylcysteine decarboxylase/phosphopantothenate--cysteine ligase
MAHLKNKTVVLGITGGIAAYKACELTRLLVKDGADVHVILTEAAKHFVTPLTLQTLSNNPVHCDMFTPLPGPLLRQKTGGQAQGEGETMHQLPFTSHISLADRADLILVAPACANTLAKAAHGICDDLLTTTICASTAPVVFAASMNVKMWNNPITQENVARLKKHGYHFIDPDVGELACGYIGVGRMAEPAEIVKAIQSLKLFSLWKQHMQPSPKKAASSSRRR